MRNEWYCVMNTQRFLQRCYYAPLEVGLFKRSCFPAVIHWRLDACRIFIMFILLMVLLPLMAANPLPLSSDSNDLTVENDILTSSPDQGFAETECYPNSQKTSDSSLNSNIGDDAIYRRGTGQACYESKWQRPNWIENNPNITPYPRVIGNPEPVPDPPCARYWGRSILLTCSGPEWTLPWCLKYDSQYVSNCVRGNRPNLLLRWDQTLIPNRIYRIRNQHSPTWTILSTQHKARTILLQHSRQYCKSPLKIKTMC